MGFLAGDPFDELRTGLSGVLSVLPMERSRRIAINPTELIQLRSLVIHFEPVDRSAQQCSTIVAIGTGFVMGHLS